MRITPSAMFAMVMLGCAGRQTSPPPAPLQGPAEGPAATAAPPGRTAEPGKETAQSTPRVRVDVPKGWVEVDPLDHGPDAQVALMHESGSGLIVIAVRPTEGRGLSAYAEDLLIKATEGGSVTSSHILVTASGDMATFSWNRHQLASHARPPHGKVRITRHATAPERMVIVTGMWDHGRDEEYANDFKRVAKSVDLQ